MPFTPWSQQVLPPESPKQPAPDRQPPKGEQSWWERGRQRFQETGGFTWPWEQQHWENQPDWTRNIGKFGLGAGLTAMGALGGIGLAGGLGAVGGAASLPWWVTYPALAARMGPKMAPFMGGVAGLMGSPNIATGTVGEPLEGQPVLPPWATDEPGQVPGQPDMATPEGLPQPGDVDFAQGADPNAPPQVIESGGERWWWNPSGGAFFTGGWERIAGGSAEQQIAEEASRRETQRLLEEQRGTTQMGLSAQEAQQRLAQLQEQGRIEQGLIGAQSTAAREEQMARAAQQQASIYASDPYKYWAQMGMGTPEAVARLTGGEIGAGEQFQQGVPLSMPSQQWWSNLMPSEQQQISGGLNWMGIDPQDWQAMRQRMIPGLAQRQGQATWAR